MTSHQNVVQKESKNERLWTSSECEALIIAVEKFPCLYDTCRSDYKDTNVKTNANKVISQQFPNCTPSDVASRWSILKDKYSRQRRLLNKEPPSGSSSQEAKSAKGKPWPLYSLLGFLDKHIKQRTRTSNVTNVQKQVKEEELEKKATTEELNFEVGNFICTDVGNGILVEIVSDEDNWASEMSILSDMKEKESSPSHSTSDRNNPAENSPLDSNKEKELSPNSTTKRNYPDECSPLNSNKENLHPKKKSKKKIDMQEQEFHENMNAALRQIISMQPTAKLPQAVESPAGIGNNLTEEWATYGREYGKKIAQIPDEFIRRTVRFEMEKLLHLYGGRTDSSVPFP